MLYINLLLIAFNITHLVETSIGGKGKGTHLVETSIGGKGKGTLLVETCYARDSPSLIEPHFQSPHCQVYKKN